MRDLRRASLALGAATIGAVWLSAQGTPPSSLRIRGVSAAASAAEAARERELKAKPAAGAIVEAARGSGLKAMPSAKAKEAAFDVMTAEPLHKNKAFEIPPSNY